MISHLDATIEAFLRNETPLTEAECHIIFEIPDDTWGKMVNKLEGEKMALNVYLYDVRENRKLRTKERTVQPNADRTVTERQMPARVDCHYLITAWAAKPELGIDQWGVAREEHHLLSQVLQTLLRFPVLPSAHLQGDLATLVPTPEIPTAVARPDGMKNLGDFWNSVKSAWRPAIAYTVTIPFDLFYEFTAPMVVTKEMRYGQPRMLYGLQVRPSLYHDYRQETTLLQAAVGPVVTRLQNAASGGDNSITVTDADNLHENDVLMIGSGITTEFCRLGPLIAPGATLPIAWPLLHDHEANTPLHQVTDDAAAGSLGAAAPKDSWTLEVEKTCFDGLNVGDVIRIGDSDPPAYVQVTSRGGTRSGLRASAEALIQIGGTVTVASAPHATLTGAEVTVAELGLTATTDAEGQFTFANLGAGTYTLRAEATGYAVAETTIKVPGARGEYDIRLLPNP